MKIVENGGYIEVRDTSSKHCLCAVDIEVNNYFASMAVTLSQARRLVAELTRRIEEAEAKKKGKRK